jgi:hypothetical protein
MIPVAEEGHGLKKKKKKTTNKIPILPQHQQHP